MSTPINKPTPQIQQPVNPSEINAEKKGIGSIKYDVDAEKGLKHSVDSNKARLNQSRKEGRHRSINGVLEKLSQEDNPLLKAFCGFFIAMNNRQDSLLAKQLSRMEFVHAKRVRDEVLKQYNKDVASGKSPNEALGSFEKNVKSSVKQEPELMAKLDNTTKNQQSSQQTTSVTTAPPVVNVQDNQNPVDQRTARTETQTVTNTQNIQSPFGGGVNYNLNNSNATDKVGVNNERTAQNISQSNPNTRLNGEFNGFTKENLTDAANKIGDTKLAGDIEKMNIKGTKNQLEIPYKAQTKVDIKEHRKMFAFLQKEKKDMGLKFGKQTTGAKIS